MRENPASDRKRIRIGSVKPTGNLGFVLVARVAGLQALWGKALLLLNCCNRLRMDHKQCGKP
jgi:hypothetical protein